MRESEISNLRSEIEFHVFPLALRFPFLPHSFPFSTLEIPSTAFHILRILVRAPMLQLWLNLIARYAAAPAGKRWSAYRRKKI
jgi:hypothetical protein